MRVRDKVNQGQTRKKNEDCITYLDTFKEEEDAATSFNFEPDWFALNDDDHWIRGMKKGKVGKFSTCFHSQRRNSIHSIHQPFSK